ncbi:uncharacterized protein LOC129732275 [Wyeomyia smithii]|uniref:uncharacterized protein LOC129732275 n=1 Tax=Wyeomyia smithii TaxID=174621 RepID=UPI0024680C0D|nr:uncharacterized protein LOC129732275 [Wyeomyia smithii]
MDHSDDDEYIEEEMLLFVDFDKFISQDELTDSNVKIKFVGIETETPIIQVNNDVYQGSYDFALGTNVFLEEDTEAKKSIDPLYSPDPARVFKYSGQSNKVLKMQRIFVTPKTEVVNVKNEPGSGQETDQYREKERYLVTRTYEEALNLHLPEGQYPPRSIEPENNCEQVVLRTRRMLAGSPSLSDCGDDPADADYVP